MWQNLLKILKHCNKPATNQSVYRFYNAALAVGQVQQQRLLQSDCSATDIFNSNEMIQKDADIIHNEDFDLANDMLTGKSKLIENLKKCYHLSDENVNLMIKNEAMKDVPFKLLLLKLKILFNEGVNRKAILNNVWLFKMDKESLLHSISLVRSIEGLREINDFIPFMRLKLQRLHQLVTLMNEDCKQLNGRNRVYYLADKLRLKPSFITEYLVKRLFILEMPLDTFKTNLDIMVNYNVEPLNMLKDLWSFRYTPMLVEMRLRRAKLAKKYPIMPWMIRCPEYIFEKSLQMSRSEVQILDGKNTVVEYVAERLGFTVQEANSIMSKHPQVLTVRITKVKEILDYLLGEAGYSQSDVALVPRILCHSLITTKQRLEELKKYDYRPLTLSVVCRSKREYNKFLQNLIESKSKTQSNEKEEGLG